MTPRDVNRVVARHFRISYEMIMKGNDKKRSVPARAAAMLLCRDLLKLSSLKQRKVYGKNAWSTILHNWKLASDLTETDPRYRKHLEDARNELMALQQRQRDRKQEYNLHFRVRKKGIRVQAKDRTIICTEEQAAGLSDRQTMKLIRKHKYAIQLSLL